MRKLLATTAAAALAAAVTAAFAQLPDAPAPAADTTVVLAQAADPAAAPADRFARRHDGERAFRMPSERVEARLAYIQTALKITDTQRQQWDAYASVLRRHAAAMDERFKARRASMEKGPGERARPSVVERHERQRDRMVLVAQRLDELIAVEKPLYAALSPDQKRVADEVLSPRGRGGPGRHGHGRFMHRTGFGRG